MKKFLSGFIISAIIFSCISVFAAEDIANLVVKANPFPIHVNGVDKPIKAYNINDTTYIATRDMAEATDGAVNVSFENTQKIINIDTTSNVEASITSTEEVKTMSTRIIETPDGLMVDYFEGKNYIAFLYIDNKAKEFGYTLQKDLYTKQWNLKKSDGTIVIENITTKHFYGTDNIEYDYYINNIMPLLK